MKTISKQATLFDGNGYIQAQGVKVVDHGDTISIGRSEHSKSDLIITSEEISSKVGNWTIRI